MTNSKEGPGFNTDNIVTQQDNQKWEKQSVKTCICIKKKTVMSTEAVLKYSINYLFFFFNCLEKLKN